MSIPDDDETLTLDRSSATTPQQQQQQQSPTTNHDDDDEDNHDSCVHVAVRVRPLLAQEGGSDRCLRVLSPSSVQLGGPAGPRFTFDHVLDSPTRQTEVYQQLADSLVSSCLLGYNATCLAYGQTGSGKTFTMLGGAQPEEQGIVPRVLEQIFAQLPQQPESSVRLQFLEVYGDEIRDLLATHTHSSTTTTTNNNTTTDAALHKLVIRENNGEPEVVGATQWPVSTAAQAVDIMQQGMLRRVTGATAMNRGSSRSHALLSVLVQQPLQSSKFHLVDLAGSERLKRTQAEGKRLKEGIDINKGLLVLGNVISALGDPQKRGKAFVPYRDSKLTRLLKGSLGGNHKTLMIACVSPSEDNLEETLNCLRYANRAKNIQNNAIVNVDPTARRTAELQQTIQTLAAILCLALDTRQPPTLPQKLTREVLQTWAGGGDETGHTTLLEHKPHNTTILAPPTPLSSSHHGNVSELEFEITRLREELRQTQAHQDQAEEQLYVAKAQKELFELQLSVNASSDEPAAATEKPTQHDQSQEHEGDDEDDDESPKKKTKSSSVFGRLRRSSRLSKKKATTAEGNTDNGNDELPPSGRTNEQLGQAFVQKAMEYEQEIGKLRKQLLAAETKYKSHAGSFRVSKAERDLQGDRERLDALQSMVSSKSGSQLEENDDGEDVDHLTKKYLLHAGHDEDEEDFSLTEHGDTKDASSQEDIGTTQKEEDLQANLVELSRSIAAKEELIDQLKFSQEKYASMREFYEEKVHQMEQALNEKESEREQLLRELEQAKSGGSHSQQLQDRLREKEQNIASLRKKHRQLVDLTAVSSRNQAKITKLQDDVKEMKHKKVDFQKQLTRERKDHAKEVRQLQKEAMQKDRELNKYKKISVDRENQAQRANVVAKARMAELSQLRSKYRDAEKRLRLQSVKRGVIAKAGLDPVMLGRRTGSRKNRTNSKQFKKMDTDSLRDFFDGKVAELVRKEALVDKLAREWEEHFELTTLRERLLEASVDGDTDDENAQSLDIQIQFKEDRIRSLATKLGNPTKPGSKHDEAKDDALVNDEKFTKILEGSDPEISRDAVAKVLLGMIVKEKRRTAALARTASSLDERLQAAEKDASVSESAFRTYVEEQTEEVATLSHNQQEHILSLMDLVKEKSAGGSFETGTEEYKPLDAPGDSTLLVLANERIAVLEQYLNDVKSQMSRKDAYQEKVEELSRAYNSKSDEVESLADEISELRTVTREIEEEAKKYSAGDSTSSSFCEAVERILNRNQVATTEIPTQSEISKSHARSSGIPTLTKTGRVDSYDTDDDVEGGAEWADDIMADLALIADGKVPPSLEESVAMTDDETKTRLQMTSSVFDRLADPQSFTGTQKQVQSSLLEAGGHQGRKAMSREISNCLDKIVIPGEGEGTGHYSADVEHEGTSKSHRSVFDRLMSPSQYTGTQKEKIQKSRNRKNETEDEAAATKILDDILGNDEQQAQGNESSSHSLYSDYTQLDVFERLQKTTTQAYAVKHGASLPHDTKLHQGISPPNGHTGVASSRRDDSALSPPGLTQVDVFERLTTTTTEAYAKKANRSKRDEH